MVKKLCKVGNSNAIILDKTLLELAGIEPGSKVNVQVNGTMICLTPMTPKHPSPEAFKSALDEVMLKHGEVLRRLAK
ncbi:MAG: AbrB/MazE/SpoVT family DNA-binding domain-containing protein [Planctomycetota bacterium]